MEILKISKVNIFIVGLMMAILLCWSSQVQAAQDGDYTYTVTADEAQITGYTGAGGDIIIPGALAGYPVTSIGDQAFFECTGLTSIRFPQGVTSIGNWAFGGCPSLTGVSIPESVTSIGDAAFYSCPNLTTISLPQGITNIGNWAFGYCGSLTGISIPESVTSIGAAAFYDCTSLNSITFNSATTSIYDLANAIPATTKIIGYDPSTAKDYAAKYNRTFEVIGVTPTNAAVTGVTLNKTIDYIAVNRTDQLTATIAPAVATNQAVTWSSSSDVIATVSSTGFVTGKKTGTATITVTTADGKFTATCAVTVKSAVTAVTGISLNKTSDKLAVGKTEILKATLTPSTATNKLVGWTSDNESVATVDSKGKVTAVAAGTANITVTCSDGNFPATCLITVVVPVTGITLSKDTDTLNVGATDMLTATVNPKGATDQSVTWTSSNTKVAMVDNGLVTAVAAGSATITVKTTDGKKTAKCKVNVVIPVAGVSLKDTDITLKLTRTQALSVIFNPVKSTDKLVSWESSLPSVATVDAKGKVTAEGVGTTVITVTTDDGHYTATCNVTVVKPVIGVSLTPATVTLSLSGTTTASLTAALNPVDATNQGVSWTSSNAKVAMVDTNGNITAVSAGKATITVKTQDGSKTVRCTVTVTK